MSNQFFSYTNRSYEEARQEGISKIPVYSNGTWTDTNASDPGIIILDYIHALVDMIQYYQDHNALEVYLSTAKERKNIFRIAKQLGYQIRSSKGASATVTFSTNKAYGTSYVIPKGTKISTNKSPIIDYLTTKDVVVYAGQTSIEVPCVQGTLGNLTYKGTGISSLDNTLNPEDQYIILPISGVDIDSISIMDNSGVLWSSTEYVVLCGKDEKCFEPKLEHDGKIKIQFGSGERGYSPKTTDELYITYIHNLGSTGKVGSGELTVIESNAGNGFVITADDGTYITGIKATNLLPSVGGSDPESSRDIVANAPRVIKTNDRAVTLEDFEVLARRVSGVKDAKAYDIKNAPEGLQCLHYEVKLLVIPETGESIDSIKDSVYNYLSKRLIPPVVLTVLSPTYETINVSAKIVIENNYYEDDIKYNVTKVLNDYFNSLTTQIGVEILPNVLISLISSVVGVRYVESIEPSAPVIIPSRSIAKLGEVNLTMSKPTLVSNSFVRRGN